MWAILNINLNKIEFFKNFKKIGSEYKRYVPKIKLKLIKIQNLLINPFIVRKLYFVITKSETNCCSKYNVVKINYVLLDYKFAKTKLKFL